MITRALNSLNQVFAELRQEFNEIAIELMIEGDDVNAKRVRRFADRWFRELTNEEIKEINTIREPE